MHMVNPDLTSCEDLATAMLLYMQPPLSFAAVLSDKLTYYIYLTYFMIMNIAQYSANQLT